MKTADGHEITKGMTVYSHGANGQVRRMVVAGIPGAGSAIAGVGAYCWRTGDRCYCWCRANELFAARGDEDIAVTA